jgi:hypothetical protein
MDPRPHIRRREGALDRLRGLTTTAAVAGVAGTAVFGAVAAASWSGNPSAASAADLGTGSNPLGDTGIGTSPTTAPDRRQVTVDPNDLFGSESSNGSGSTGGGGSARIRPTVPGQGRSHATTGGSG